MLLVKEETRLKEKFGDKIYRRVRTKTAGGFEEEIKTPKGATPFHIKFNRYPVSGGLDFLYAFKDYCDDDVIPEHVSDERLRGMKIFDYLVKHHPDGLKGDLYEDKAWFDKRNAGVDLKQAVLAKAIRKKAEEATEEAYKKLEAVNAELAEKQALLNKTSEVLQDELVPTKNKVSEAPKKRGRKSKVSLESLVQ